ncbi:MAG: phosphoribosylformylglycinamidine synthase subunit PurQ, partial [Bdellovibrionales bacterium]|nr:phosphoribosylformylglycinamidine synthase subunit PurQ [Bdellovibrionales bacterium]
MTKIALTRFPGTNCDADVWKACEALGYQPQWWWHSDQFDAKSVDGVVIPGGFSFGDYLRAGALASRSPVMASVKDASKLGKPVLGICNGFQILCESGLLPGVLVKNTSLRFVDEWVDLEVLGDNPFGKVLKSKKQTLRLPVAHGMGKFVLEDESKLQPFKESGRVWVEYKKNPNGAWGNIAGVTDATGKVCALMPHP